ncbi:MAG TPA: GMC family oxidoreductase N-terminal domain-containing protein [Dehalococcoidia bacterium]|nr:GMC family oxidoreductase N-terminal domain-containing protein [Dehalococcoidia bacterium]
MATDYDLIVVGAGAGGAVVAARVTEDPRIRVLLIEAGPDYPNVEGLPEDLRNANHGSFFDHDWRLRYQPSSTSRVNVALPRGRVTGGSSAVNTAIALRGQPTDYDEWASLGNPLWSWQKVLPAFIRLETDLDFGDKPYHGDSGPIPIRRHTRDELVPFQAACMDAFAAKGYPDAVDHNDPESTGYAPHPMNKRGQLRISTSIAYLGPARGRPNLVILPDTDCVRVTFERGAATGVEVRTKGGATQRTTARQVVLAAGAIHTPPILVRSGIGPRETLERLGIAETTALEGVGQHMQDHPAIGPTLEPKEGIADWEQPVIQTTLRYTATGSSDFNDMQIEPLSFMHMPGGRLLMGLAACVFKSYSYGRLVFESADVGAAPRIEMDYLSDERDYAKIVDGLRRAMEIVQMPQVEAVSLGIRRPTEDELGNPAVLEAWIRAHASSGAHPSCTARMGPADDPTAVVDQRGFVHGVRGLRIADASIMPRVPSANTNVPTIMIGERMGEWAREELAGA